MFTTTAELKVIVGGSVNQSIEITSILPTINQSAKKHLTAWLGRKFIGQLLMNYPDAPEGAHANYADIYPELQKVLGWLGVHDYSKIGGIEFSEAGLLRTESDKKKSAYKHQEEQFRRQMLDFGLEALEELIMWIEEQPSDQYPLYEANGAKLAIRGGADLRNHYSHYVSRETYHVLRPLLEDVQEQFIRTVMGATLYDRYTEWLDSPRTNPNLLGTPTQTVLDRLHFLVQRAVTNITIKDAISRHILMIDGQNVVFEKKDDVMYQQQGRGTILNQQLKIDHHNVWARTYLEQIYDHLEANKAAFSGYPYAWPSHASSCSCNSCAWTAIHGSSTEAGAPYLPSGNKGIVYF